MANGRDNNAKNNHADSNSNGYVKYDPDDVTYFGAQKIVDEERIHVIKRRQILDKKNPDVKINNDLTGLALSGGGIRSASFCLGVLQALSYRNVLKKIDYLSTVSGGGYIGSSLTWLLSRKWYSKVDEQGKPVPDGELGPEIKLGVDKIHFPYGTYPMLGQQSEPETDKSEYSKRINEVKHRGALLRFLRQHGKYLTPGHGITGMSLLGVLLRGSLLSIFVYFSLLVLIMAAIDAAGAFSSFEDIRYTPIPVLGFLFNVPNFSILIGCVGLVFFVLCAPVYSLLAYGHSRRKNKENINQQKQEKLESKSYKWRRFCEKAYNVVLKTALVFIVIGLISVVHDELSKTGSGFMAGLTGAISTAIGFISSISAYIKTSNNKKGIIPISLLVLVGTIALWFGLLLLAYHCNLVIKEFDAFLAIFGGLLVVVAIVGWRANLNYISVHRYYRDRLMETFMPDVPDVLIPDTTPQKAAEFADKARLSDMCGYDVEENEDEAPNQPEKEDNDNECHPLCMPYHIINTNLVLVSSKKAKFKGRGGDNFILSPAYCGSNATGWQQTSNFMGDRMTLPTAMAISGAAVNPSTGVGGDGVTRQPFLSMLMGLLNIRLGYWAPHPRLPEQKRIPNFFIPGIFELFFRSNLEEDSDFLQLSDGGHFENLGIYELIRRKANIIIACDAAADPNYDFTDLSNALEKIRADFGVLINISTHQLEAMIPRKNNNLEKSEYAKKGFIMADILYPDREPGTFIFLKSTFFRALSADLYGYKQTHKEFPDEPTSDQFFDEKQFEAYRELGYQTAWEMMNHGSIKADSTLSKFFSSEK